MAHFYEIALLGLFIQLILILKNRLTAFFVVSIFALHLGRNFMLILTSTVFYTCLCAREKNGKYLLLLFVHIMSFVSSFGYNVLIEAMITGKRILDTSILQTFQYRTGLTDQPLYEVEWSSYLRAILER